jgi:SRSO17 transposase
VPEAERRRLSKGRIALELLDRARAEGLPGRVVVADSGYGISGPFRDGLAGRGLHYVLGVADDKERPGLCPATASTPSSRNRSTQRSMVRVLQKSSAETSSQLWPSSSSRSRWARKRALGFGSLR